MDHLTMELVRNSNVALIHIEDKAFHITPDSFTLFSQEVARIAETPGSAHLTLQLSDETIPFDEESDETV